MKLNNGVTEKIENTKKTLDRGTGMLIIEVINSNPNGDPDRDSDPRMRYDGRGIISPVSFKRKIRDIVLAKEGHLWLEIKSQLGLNDENYNVLEQKELKPKDLIRDTEEILSEFWDARIFGATVLRKKEKEEAKKAGGRAKEAAAEVAVAGEESSISSGVVQFGVGVSLDPIRIERMTNTKVRAVDNNKDSGMAPLGFRVVQYGLYQMPFFINATAASKSNCTIKDIELLLNLIPFAYQETASFVRPQVNIRHAFYFNHGRPRGTVSDFKILELLSPARKPGYTGPATSISEYDIEGMLDGVRAFNARQADANKRQIVDLIEEIAENDNVFRAQ